MKVDREVLCCWADIVRLFCVAIVLTGVSSCGQAETHKRVVVNADRIVAGPGEKTFVERYHVSLSLPMPEVRFLEVLKGLKLDVEIYAERNTKRTIPPPRYSSSVDLRRIKRVYQIYGEIDRSRRTGEKYRAYVDSENRVVYLENNFSYTGP